MRGDSGLNSGGASEDGERESEDALISGVLSLDSSVLSGPLSCEI